MGAKLVRAAYDLAARDRFQDHRSMRLLAYMALTALDADPQPSFFGGEEALVRAIAGTDASTMRRSLRSLQDAGYISKDGRGAHTGRRSTYLLLDGAGDPLRPVQEAGQIAPPLDARGGADRPVSAREEAGRFVPRGGADRPQEAGQIAPPKEEGGTKEEEDTPQAPPRTCTRHSTWEHTQPCRECRTDRRAAETHRSTRRTDTMSPLRPLCEPGTHRWLRPEHNGTRTCMLCPAQWPTGEPDPNRKHAA